MSGQTGFVQDVCTQTAFQKTFGPIHVVNSWLEFVLWGIKAPAPLLAQKVCCLCPPRLHWPLHLVSSQPSSKFCLKVDVDANSPINGSFSPACRLYAASIIFDVYRVHPPSWKASKYPRLGSLTAKWAFQSLSFEAATPHQAAGTAFFLKRIHSHPQRTSAN